MTPGELPTPEQYLEQVKKTQEELYRLRAKAWEKVYPEIVHMLDESAFPTSPNVRKIFIGVLQAVWLKGYNSGAGDMSKHMAREMGMGAMIDMMEIFEKQTSTHPENN